MKVPEKLHIEDSTLQFVHANKNCQSVSKDWLSSKLLCDILDISNQTFQYHREKNWVSRLKNCEDGSKYEILISSLLPEQIAKYNQYLMLHEGEEKIDFKPNLTDKQKEIALAKHFLLRKYFEFIEGANCGIIEAKTKFTSVFNQGTSYPEVFKKIGEVNWKTIDTHWIPIWREAKEDPFSLAPQYAKKKSTVTQEEAKLLTDKALTPNNRPIRQCARDARDEMLVRNLPNVKSLQTYTRWLQDFKVKNIDVWTLVRQGRKALSDKIVKPVSRDYANLEVGDIVVGDGHKLNFEILDPFTGKYRRMNLILFYEMYSAIPLGWDISLTEDTQTITIAFYRTVLRLGKIPKIVYLDNGRAFRSKFLNGMEADLEQSGVVGLFERLGCRVIFAKPYNAKAKTIERFFRTLSELEMKIPTYCGTSIENKPPRMMRNEKLHKRIFDKVMENTVIDIWTAHSLLADYFDQYAERTKESGRLKGQKPMDLFRAGMGPGVDKTLLLWFMMEEKEKKVYNEGIKLFGNKIYWCDELYDYVGQYVTIRYDIINPDFIFVLDYKNNIIGKALLDTGVHPAAGYLGNETDVQKLTLALKRQENQYNTTYERAASLLNREMMPSINRKVEEAKEMLQLKQAEEHPEKEIKVSQSVFKNIKTNLPIAEEENTKPIFYKKASEA